MSSSNAPPPLAGTTAGTFAAGNDSRITGAVQAGANSSITSLTGLTTPLTQGQGGTGATTLGAATMTPTGGVNGSLASLLSGGTNLPVLQFSTNSGTNVAALTQFGGPNFGITNNMSSGSTYINTGTATRLQITPTGYNFQYAASGTAGAACSPATVVSIDSSGNVVASGTLASGPVTITGSSSSGDIYVNGSSAYGVNSNGNHTTADIGAVGVAPYGLSVSGAHTIAGIVSNAQIVDQSCSYATPTTGQTVTIGATTSGVDLNPAGTLATLTVAFPTAPINGQPASITSTQIITALTLSASQTIYGGITTLAAGGKAKYKYVSGGSYWIAVQ